MGAYPHATITAWKKTKFEEPNPIHYCRRLMSNLVLWATLFGAGLRDWLQGSGERITWSCPTQPYCATDEKIDIGEILNPV
jgi:hypothetical protein